ncbi:hypothetical protein TRVL_01209 [Trypanosoma vivax]|nr:hypothetical protein TRVL_01209 [Trypanosoma vivax]
MKPQPAAVPWVNAAHPREAGSGQSYLNPCPYQAKLARAFQRRSRQGAPLVRTGFRTASDRQRRSLWARRTSLNPTAGCSNPPSAHSAGSHKLARFASAALRSND